MTKIEQLIKELCPNGVESVAIKDYFTRLKGTPITAGKMKEIESSDGEIRIFAGGKTVINAREKDIPNANITRVPAVLVQSRGVIDFIYYEKPFTFKNEMWAYTAENKITVKYLYYVLQNNTQHFRDSASGMGSLPQISLHVTEDFKIPVPPLEVQTEIVKILDEYTASVTALQQELEKELTARKKQYEYYRDLLLDFGVHGGATSECEWRTLGDVSDSFTGLTYKPSDTAKNGTIVLRSSNIKESRLVFDDNVYVQMTNIPQRAIVKENDILICVRNGSKALIGKAAIIPKLDVKMAFGAFMTILRPNKSINPKYLFYVWQSPRIQDMIHGNSGMPINQITKNMLEKIKIPVPPIEEQERIVSILDRFDKLCNDISEGLPAEIEARRKQYEYYRDKLLTF